MFQITVRDIQELPPVQCITSSASWKDFKFTATLYTKLSLIDTFTHTHTKWYPSIHWEVLMQNSSWSNANLVGLIQGTHRHKWCSCVVTGSLNTATEQNIPSINHWTNHSNPPRPSFGGGVEGMLSTIIKPLSNHSPLVPPKHSRAHSDFRLDNN